MSAASKSKRIRTCYDDLNAVAHDFRCEILRSAGSDVEATSSIFIFVSEKDLLTTVTSGNGSRGRYYKA